MVDVSVTVEQVSRCSGDTDRRTVGGRTRRGLHSFLQGWVQQLFAEQSFEIPKLSPAEIIKFLPGQGSTAPRRADVRNCPHFTHGRDQRVAKSKVVQAQALHEENEATRQSAEEAAAEAAASVTAALDRRQAAETFRRRAVEASKQLSVALHNAQRESDHVLDKLLESVEDFDNQVHSITMHEDSYSNVKKMTSTYVQQPEVCDKLVVTC